VEIKDGIGNPRWVAANLVDVIGGGCGLALMTRLKSGSTVVLRGKFGKNGATEHLRAGVKWCVARTDGTFRAGLEFLDNRTAFQPGGQWTNSTNPATLDCYEVMQLSPSADAETISRVYRMLAFRYHPDNAETGNSEMFLRLSEAYQILSDPEKRTSYDMRRRGANRVRGKNSDQPPPSAGTKWDKRINPEAITEAYLGISLGAAQGAVCWEG